LFGGNPKTSHLIKDGFNDLAHLRIRLKNMNQSGAHMTFMSELINLEIILERKKINN
jgi:hypothetical protein